MVRTRRDSKQTLGLLSVLLEQPRKWRHGYDLSRETTLKSGTLYPILMRLSDRGLLDSKWEPAAQAGRPPRHMHRLSKKGVSYARERVATAALSEPLANPQGSPA